MLARRGQIEPPSGAFRSPEASAGALRIAPRVSKQRLLAVWGCFRASTPVPSGHSDENGMKTESTFAVKRAESTSDSVVQDIKKDRDKCVPITLIPVSLSSSTLSVHSASATRTQSSSSPGVGGLNVALPGLSIVPTQRSSPVRGSYHAIRTRDDFRPERSTVNGRPTGA